MSGGGKTPAGRRRRSIKPRGSRWEKEERKNRCRAESMLVETPEDILKVSLRKIKARLMIISCFPSSSCVCFRDSLMSCQMKDEYFPPHRLNAFYTRRIHLVKSPQESFLEVRSSGTELKPASPPRSQEELKVGGVSGGEAEADSPLKCASLF